jgi:hypothetical protein
LKWEIAKHMIMLHRHEIGGAWNSTNSPSINNPALPSVWNGHLKDNRLFK